MDYQQPVSDNIKIAQKIVIVHPEDNTKFLLLKRIKPDNSEVIYDLPGGNLAKGELHEESLRREIMEETGLEVLEINPNEIQTRIQPSGVLFLYLGYVALAKTTNVTLENDIDSNDFAWISPDDFKKLAGNHIILNQAQKAVRLITPLNTF